MFCFFLTSSTSFIVCENIIDNASPAIITSGKHVRSRLCGKIFFNKKIFKHEFRAIFGRWHGTYPRIFYIYIYIIYMVRWFIVFTVINRSLTSSSSSLSSMLSLYLRNKYTLTIIFTLSDDGNTIYMALCT